MTWAKISDDFADDCWTLSSEAVRLHVEVLCWNARKLYNCLVPKDDLPRFARNDSVGVDELIEHGWWVDRGDHWQIVHHSKYQPTRESVLHQQAVNTDNGKKGGRPKASGREQAGDIPTQRTESVSESVSEPQSESSTETETHREGKGQDRTCLEGEHNVKGDEHETVDADPAVVVQAFWSGDPVYEAMSTRTVTSSGRRSA